MTFARPRNAHWDGRYLHGAVHKATARRSVVAGLLLVAGLVAWPVAARAQAQPKADVSVVTDADGVRAGGTVRVAVRVALPDGVHMQSNAPRDQFLIATAVTAALPSGVTLLETVYPPAKDFVQKGVATPLAIFDQHFVIGVKLAIAANVVPGELVVPIRLRYQACNEEICFIPRREEVPAVVRVVAANVTPKPQFPELFTALKFAR